MTSHVEVKLATLNGFNAQLVMQSNMLLGTVGKNAKQRHQPQNGRNVETVEADEGTIGRT